MPNAIAYTGTVGKEDGRLYPDNPEDLRFAITYFKGKKVKIIIEELKETRSNQQNRAWFGIVVKAFMEQTGIRDKLYMHRVILEHIGHYDLVEVLGKMEKKVKSTHDLQKKDFSVLYEAAQQLGAEYGVMIPEPNASMQVDSWVDSDSYT